ncbi:MAG: Jag N-terminal domain-containing protein [Actinobacteria bacterium]|nr:Jag N-terminal domain-containing protein [Actinomycetota bacterium]
MEWVETTGKTVDEAKERALDQLGVHHEDAEFEVLEEPKAGLFGRVRGEARVRARVRPAQVRQKVDRRDRKRSDRPDKAEKGERAPKAEKTDKTEKSDASGEKAEKAPRAAKSANGGTRQRQPREPKPAAERTPKPNPKSSEEQAVDARQVGEEATRFMSGLIEAFGYTGAVELVEDGDDLEVRVQGKELGLLVGPRGTTLQAVQDLARVASQRRLGDHDTRLRVDVGGYRERRRQALGQFAQQMADEVKASAVARVLEPMSSADRKIIHDTLADVEGIATRSEGDDPYRRVIIAPVND